MFGKKKMNEKEVEIEEFDDLNGEKIPVFDKRRFNADGEAKADEGPKEPVRSPKEIALEADLKAEIERREAAESKLVGVQAKFEEAKSNLERETAEMRTRLMKTLEDRSKQAQFSFLTTLLPVLDNLNLAVSASENDASIDNLRSGDAEHWLPQGTDGRPKLRPLPTMIDAAVRVWLRNTPRPVVIVAARAATPSARRLVQRRAAAAGMKFLFVESRSHAIRAFARLSAMSLPKEELIRVMKRYDQAVAQFVPVDRIEMKTLPVVRLNMVLSDVDEAARTVLARWATL